jgi:protein-disulfide isomerase
VPVLEQVFEKNSEKIKIIFKNFPIRGHAFAVKAAQAVLAANSLGKFWEFHDLLFKNYNTLNDAKIEEIRTRLGLDADQFQARMNDPQVLAQINAEASLGRKLGVRGTPTVFVNGRLLKDKSPNGFKAAVNEALRELPEKK